ncbi:MULTISPECIES: monovalent cation:proton antiporter-2 (CPA2) family protein [unclassified Aureimonas]|uniref:monovalent cation:proton antiporter-2 (CPA2) family protein n=1 Tax=unclassified Aureimonas TaxID=2615206 RepID=UPI0006F2465D|nr:MULTISPECIES: monovalent cation:proton antiporter-2 (CPA2) family protein [unclassified Aureimonas]KQT70051.1 potassium transporter TrkA [Aureimonas sp. Leaf427]KQT76305.1 potassium transporter TrkA [Aureimonas sp. Leaf460]
MLLGGGILAGTLFKRIGLGTVLGYLFAGVVMGPILRLFEGRGEEILHVGELGVVFLLFIIGLELKLSRLWSLRRQIFGLGLAQVVLTGAVLVLAAGALGIGWPAATIIGFGLALSSTAFGLQLLEEAGETNTRHGQAAFSILLFQDLAVVPLLALVPFLAPSSGAAGFDPVQIAISVGAILALLAAGRYLLNPLFWLMARSGAREVMIAGALFVVLGSALLMAAAGFSMAMGAFIAGVLLAESTYRHELEADIEPFRGILLGLFFIGVGLSLDLSILIRDWLAILVVTPALLLVKAGLLFGLSRLFGESPPAAARIAALLPQGGEFAFVLFAAAAAAGIFPGETSSLLVAIVTLSMALTPLTAFIGARFSAVPEEEQLEEDFDGAGSEVLMIGFSRFAQITAQVLLSQGTDVTIIDNSAERIRNAARFGFRIYFGSGLRRDVLEAAGIRKARIVAVCTNRRETTDAIVDLVRSEFPNVRLYVRSYDRNHSLSLRERGVEYEMRETLESALVFGGDALVGLGVDPKVARSIVSDVRRRDRERLTMQSSEGTFAGPDLVTTKKATPEPLVKPKAKHHPTDAPGRPVSEPAESI